MEDYDILSEMKNFKNKKVIIVIEDNENDILECLDAVDFEVMPIRLSYDLSCFSNDYIEKTKKLFTYYYNHNNTYDNELLRLKKHFIHYQRFPDMAYIPVDERYSRLRSILSDLGVECIDDKENFLKRISNNKLILIDSDGTLKKTDGTISERTIEAISKIRLLGNRVIICTARPRYQAVEVMKECGADEIVISSNGSEIYDNKNKKIVFCSSIDVQEVFKLVEYAYSKDIRLILTLDDFEYVTKEVRNFKQKLLDRYNYRNDLLYNKIKQCMFIDKRDDELSKLKVMLSKNENISIIDEINQNDSCEEKWFSIVNSTSSKGDALIKITNYLKIPIENTISIGNDSNDVSMFEKSGFSVAVSNSSKLIKDRVDFVTLSNDEDGVALFLELLL